MEKFKFLYSIFSKINSLPSSVKTLIILILVPSVVAYYCDRYRYETQTQRQLNKELYTIEKSNEINDCLTLIEHSDTCISRVLLCTYHNNQKSLQDLEYIYFDYTTQSSGKINAQNYSGLFKSREYMYFADELKTIQSEGGYIGTKKQIKLDFPRLYTEIFQYIKFKQVGIYPMQGEYLPLGLVIVFYDSYNKKHYVNYMKGISVPLQRLSSILDVSKNF